MNYDEFKERIIEDLKDRLGDDYNLSVNEVDKLT